MSKNRIVHLVMGHNVVSRITYVSGVYSSKKKAEEWKDFIETAMKNDSDGRVYWLLTEKVA